jgi:hypothetical protein
MWKNFNISLYLFCKWKNFLKPTLVWILFHLECVIWISSWTFFLSGSHVYVSCWYKYTVQVNVACNLGRWCGLRVDSKVLSQVIITLFTDYTLAVPIRWFDSMLIWIVMYVTGTYIPVICYPVPVLISTGTVPFTIYFIGNFRKCIHGTGTCLSSQKGSSFFLTLAGYLEWSLSFYKLRTTAGFRLTIWLAVPYRYQFQQKIILTFFVRTPGSGKTSPRQRKSKRSAGSDTE